MWNSTFELGLSYLDPEELWRKLKSLKALFSRNKELYGSREVTENAIPEEGKSSSPETIARISR